MIIFINNFSKANSTSNMNLTSLPVQSRQSAYVFLVLSSMLAVLIITGNSLVIAAYRKNTRLQTRTNVFIVSLAMSDLLVGGISVPIWTYLTFVNYEQDLDGFFEFFVNFDRVSALASIFHLTAISLERYMAISRPFDHGMLSFRFYKYMVITAWITAGAMTILSVFSKLFAFTAVSTVIVFTFGFLLQAVLMLTVYVRIFRTARALIDRTPNSRTEESIRNRVREERKVALTVSVVTILFLLAWLPFFVMSMLGQFCMHCFPEGDARNTLVTFAKWMHYTNSGVNPLVYAFRDKEMRCSFMKLIRIRGSEQGGLRRSHFAVEFMSR